MRGGAVFHIRSISAGVSPLASCDRANLGFAPCTHDGRSPKPEIQDTLVHRGVQGPQRLLPLSDVVIGASFVMRDSSFVIANSGIQFASLSRIIGKAGRVQ